MALLDLRLRELLDEVAAEGRTPGGGSAAALVTALAAGLLAKVARGSTETWPEAAGIAAQAECLRERATPLAETDAEHYEAALRARAEGSEEGDKRDFALGRAYAKAAEPPLQIVRTATDVAQLALAVAENGNPALRADAVTGALLAAAAARACAELVAVNLTASASDPRVLEAARLAEEAARAAETARAGRE
ncbi:MAG: methenyltetrahydrofolate cyclohydrolase [Gaiellaceae bacterium]|jgi:formiminotetrahydrofolate cyclodeaminase|nr:methenyltetrahydrofolate cyclohydrolase [Gaiellaceae bacterium]